MPHPTLANYLLSLQHDALERLPTHSINECPQTFPGFRIGLEKVNDYTYHTEHLLHIQVAGQFTGELGVPP
jgi:hypothetical protein